MINLNEKTTVPLWSIITAIPTLIGSITWITLVAYRVDTNVRDITDLKVRDRLQAEEINKLRDTTIDLLNQIKIDVAVIKAQVGGKKTR